MDRMQKLSDNLKEAREAKGVSVKQASNETKIRSVLIEALENGEYETFANDTHLKSFLRAYAKFLGINEDKALAMYRREKNIEHQEESDIPNRSETNSAVNNIAQKIFTIRTLIFVAVILLVGLVFAFFYSQWVVFTQPPTLLIIAPNQNDILKDESFVIEGVTDNTFVKVVVDGVEANFTDANGRFKVNAKFNQPGAKRFTVIAKNEFQRETQINLDLTYKPAAIESQKQKVKVANVGAVNYNLAYTRDNRSSLENVIIPPGSSIVIEFDSRLDVNNFDKGKLDLFIGNDTSPTDSIDSKEFSIIIENSRLIVKTK